MAKRLICPCGQLVTAEDDDQMVIKANQHLVDAHPDMANTYTRDEILFMTF